MKRTLDMPLDVLLALTAAVKRGARRARVVMGDMPFLSYHRPTRETRVRNAGRFVVEGMSRHREGRSHE
jgi:ketopantoate hydroxymethyltransferase